jgi:uncharacterized protein (TIGR02246 family)
MSTLTTTDAQALFGEQAKAWNNADAAGIAATYAPGGRLVSPDGHACDGRGVIEAAFTMLFGGSATAGMPAAWPGLFTGTTTEFSVQDIRPLAEGLAVVEATQSVGPLPPLHITAVLTQAGETAEILECRPYAFLVLP